jgi:hypothetical protein
MIDTVYIRAESKKALNYLLSSGADPQGAIFDMFRGDRYVALSELPNGTVVKIWSKKDFAGTPVAKSYGNIKRVDGKVTVT